MIGGSGTSILRAASIKDANGAGRSDKVHLMYP
jgi:hypothetical protein